jgi:hypothetical protein
MRRGLAALALVTWALGFEVGPGLHVACHEWLEEHHHPGDHDDDHEGGEDHGDHALEHHGLAALGAPVVVIVPPPLPAGELPAPPTPRLVPFDTTLDVVRSRGPPLPVQA